MLIDIDKYRGLKKLILLFAGLVILLTKQSHAQTDIVKFNRIALNNEKTNIQVSSILRDSKGYMWFGTENGLFQFDGYKYKLFKSNFSDSTTLSENRVFDICEDKDGSLWVATYFGVSKYHRASENFSRFNITDKSKTYFDNFILQVKVDKGGRVWAKRTSSGLYLLDPKTKKFEQLLINKNYSADLSDNNIIDSYIDKSGTMWFCVNNEKTHNTLYSYNYESKGVTAYIHKSADPSSLSPTPLRKLFKDSKGNIWIGLENGLDKLDVTTGKFIHYLPNKNDINSLTSGKIIALEEDDDGMIWIGTEENGLDKLDPSTGKFVHFKSNDKDEKALSSNTIRVLYNDRAGTLWIGTNKGVHTYTLNHKKFHNYLFASQDGSIINTSQINDIKTGKDKALWYSTEKGLYKLDRETKPELMFPLKGSKEFVQDRTGKFWVAGSGGLAGFDPITKKFEVDHTYCENPDDGNFNPKALWTLYLDEQEILWMGMGGGGLKGIDLKTKKEVVYLHDAVNQNSIASNEIGVIYRDKNILWVGPYKRGLNSINLKTGKVIRYNFNLSQPGGLSFPIVTAIYKDKKGRLWVGTDDGLNLLNSDGKTFKIFKEKEGLANTMIMEKSINEDSQGNIWVSTRAGISKINPETYAINNYDSKDGFQVNDQAELRKNHTGEMILFGVNGLTTFHPEEIRDNPFAPPVSISDFQVFNKSIVPGKQSPLKSVINETKEITLSYKQSFFTFEFAAQNYILTEKNQYAYMLEGFENEWNYTGTRRFAYYTKVPPGKYTFRVKAANNDGRWNEEGASVTIIITPPFWQTWWFRLCVFAGIIGCAVLFYKLRTNTIEKQKIKLQQQVHEQTLQLIHSTKEEQNARQQAEQANKDLERKNKELEQFAYVASHDLQEPLRTTSSFAELLRQQYQGKLDAKADKYFAYITEASDRMKLLIKNLLDYSRIGTKKELEQVDCNKTLHDVLADLGVAIKDAKADIQHTALPVISGYPTEIKQLFQNLVINAVKFQKKDVSPQIKISVEKINGHWQFAFKDNGIGIEKKHSEKIFNIFQRLHTQAEYEGSGIGLSHCKKIVELHKGEIWVESIPGEGSTFLFTIKENNN